MFPFFAKIVIFQTKITNTIVFLFSREIFVKQKGLNQNFQSSPFFISVHKA